MDKEEILKEIANKYSIFDGKTDIPLDWQLDIHKLATFLAEKLP